MSHIFIALIPAYEPTEILTDLAKRLSDSGFSVLIIDDGSGPAYRQIFSAAGAYARLISYEQNKGKGYALKAGFDYIRHHFDSDSVIVALDSDGQHSVSDAREIAEMAAESPGALILGVRSFGKGTPVRSQFGNTVTSIVFQLSTGLRVSDTQTGLRGFCAGLLPFLSGVDGERYEYEMNVLLKCAKKRVPIIEKPIETIYFNNNKDSHFHTLRDSLRIYENILKFAASSLAGFAIDYGLYSLLAFLLSGFGMAVSIPVSNVMARIVSAGTNFVINKRLVFKNKDSVLKTGLQYFFLAACILFGNTLLVSFLVNSLGVNLFAAKLVTELVFFLLSWLAQHFWIFRKNHAAKL